MPSTDPDRQVVELEMLQRNLRTWHAGRDLLTSWECRFLADVGTSPEQLTERQRQIVADVAGQIRKGKRKFRPAGRKRG